MKPTKLSALTHGTLISVNKPAIPTDMGEVDRLLKVVQVFCTDRKLPFVLIVHIPIEGDTLEAGRIGAGSFADLNKLVVGTNEQLAEYGQGLLAAKTFDDSPDAKK